LEMATPVPHNVSREELLRAAAWWMRDGPDYDVDGPYCPRDGPGLQGYTQYAVERLIYEVGCALRMLAAAPEVVEVVEIVYSQGGTADAVDVAGVVDVVDVVGTGVVVFPSLSVSSSV